MTSKELVIELMTKTRDEFAKNANEVTGIPEEVFSTSDKMLVDVILSQMPEEVMDKAVTHLGLRLRTILNIAAKEGLKGSRPSPKASDGMDDEMMVRILSNMDDETPVQ
jgi:hypothetical protein